MEENWFSQTHLLYSCSQKPINDEHFGQVDEFWYQVKHQMKHLEAFIWDETYFSSEIKHVHFNKMFYWLSQLTETTQYKREMSLYNYLLFHLRRHAKISGLMLHHGSRHLETGESTPPIYSLALSSVSRCLEPVMKHSPPLLTCYFLRETQPSITRLCFSITQCSKLFVWKL